MRLLQPSRIVHFVRLHSAQRGHHRTLVQNVAVQEVNVVDYGQV